MRIWGRVYAEDGSYTWQKVETDPVNGNDYVYITDLVQVLKLNLNESPFYASSGIPAHPAVIEQIVPDYYMYVTQQRFAPYFASLTISNVSLPPADGAAPVPTYRVNLTTNNGVTMAMDIPV